MKEIFDIEAWRQVIVHSLTELGSNVARFLPSLVGTLVLLGVGWVFSKLVERIVQRVLRKLGMDGAASRTRLADVLTQAGIKSSLSVLFARLVFWILMLTFVLSAVETLGLTAVTATIDRLIAFLPDVFAAGLILLMGLVLGRIARGLVSSAAAAAELPSAQRLGTVAGALVVLLVGVLALEQLGIETALLVTILTVLVATVGLTIGFSFALGAKPLVTHILAGHFLRQSLLRGSTVEVQGCQGVIERVGPLETLVRDGERAWSIPNGTLMGETVQRQGAVQSKREGSSS